MEFIEIVKDWAGVGALVAGAVWGIIKIFPDFKVAKEHAVQESEQTEQQKLVTEEKELDLDSRRVQASEEVASKALEHSAELTEENLELLKDKYEQAKTIIELEGAISKISDRVSNLEETVRQLKEERAIIAYFFCSKLSCRVRDPKLGDFKFGCFSLETLKKMMENGTEEQEA